MVHGRVRGQGEDTSFLGVNVHGERDKSILSTKLSLCQVKDEGRLEILRRLDEFDGLRRGEGGVL